MVIMNTDDSSSSLHRLTGFCNVARDEDCGQFELLRLSSSTQQEEEYVCGDECVTHDTRQQQQQQQQHYVGGNGDMSLTGVVFLIALAVSLGACAWSLYKFHNVHQQEQPGQQEAAAVAADDANHHNVVEERATETTTTTTTTSTETDFETTVASTATATSVESSSETKTMATFTTNNKQEECQLPLPQQQLLHRQVSSDDDDDEEEPDLVVEKDSSSNSNNNNNNSNISNCAARHYQPKRIPAKQEQQPQQRQHQHPVMTVVPSTTVPTSSQLAAAAARPGDDDVPDDEDHEVLTIKAAEKVLLMKKHLEHRTGETLSLDKVFEQSLDQSRHDEKMRFKKQQEWRHYAFETSRETFKNEQTQARHDEKMATKRQDDAWLPKIKACRSCMLQTLLEECLYTAYAFFAIHVLWHFFRLRQIWTFAGITSALYYSVCGGGQCGTPNDLTFQYHEDDEPSSSYFVSSDGYFSYYFQSLSSSWSTFSFLEFVAPTWLLHDLACTGICGVKIMFGVFGAIVTVMIVPGEMIKYMAAGVVTMTMLSNVFEWVPFIIDWQYMAGIYFCLGLGCYYYIEHVCRKSQRVLQTIGATPSKLQVTTEVAKLDNVKEALQKHKLVLLGLAVVCFHYSALELERNRQFAY